jgi:type IV pilus biogenesis protein CpaD/CtpE
MRIDTTLIRAVVVMACSCAIGCASNVEKHWGEAYAENNAAMIADPEAGQSEDDGVSDLEGVTVEHVIEQYRKGQQQPTSRKVPTSILIQSGSGSSSGAN